MRPPTTLELLFVIVGAATCAAFLALSVPLWRQYHAPALAVAAATPRPPAQTRTTTVDAARHAPHGVVAAPTVTLRLVAARGSCWIVIRSTSNKGAVRYAGTLEQGTSLQSRGARLWVSLGAAGNLDASLNGKRLRRFPTGTIDLIVSNAGVRQAPLAGVTPVAGNGRA